MMILAIYLSFMVGAVVSWKVCEYALDKKSTNAKYEYWKGGIYEVLLDDVLDEETYLQHIVIYRATFGRRNIYALPKHKFYGKVTNRKGEEVNRFTKIN